MCKIVNKPNSFNEVILLIRANASIYLKEFRNFQKISQQSVIYLDEKYNIYWTVSVRSRHLDISCMILLAIKFLWFDF
jgi:hypothetical protein